MIVHMYITCIPCSVVTSRDFRPPISFSESNKSPDVYFNLISLVEQGIVLAIVFFFFPDFLSFVFFLKDQE